MKNLNKTGSDFKKVTRKIVKISLVLVPVLSLFLFSCGASPEDRFANESSKTEMDSVRSVATSNAAVIGKADSSHTFIRTADIKFKVKDVKQSTFDIEDLVAKHNGYITYTNLSSTVSYQNKVQVSEDSCKERTYFVVDNSVTMRIPNTELDAVLRGLAPFMDFLDHRTIKADDIKYTLLSNQLAEKRYKNYKQRYTKAIDTKGKKLKETVNAEDNLAVNEQIADNKSIESLELMDQVNYSTVTLYIYQPQTIKETIVANEKTIPPYVPSFGKRLGNAVRDGWHIFEEIILFFINIWGVLVLMVALFFLIRWFVTYLSKPDVRKV
jgi:PKD repeat protein